MCCSKVIARSFVAVSAVLCLLALSAQSVLGQTTSIVRVEEDWTMMVGDPSPVGVAPQILCVISPVGNVESVYGALSLNHGDVPHFVAGGVQLDAWQGSAPLASKRIANQAVLATPAETIRWTTVMRLTPEGLVFEILNGQSATWGSFGDDESLKVTVPTSLSNLNGYNTQVSVEHSGATYAATRVQSLVLERVRVIDANGTVAEDANRHVVHSLAE